MQIILHCQRFQQKERDIRSLLQQGDQRWLQQNSIASNWLEIVVIKCVGGTIADTAYIYRLSQIIATTGLYS